MASSDKRKQSLYFPEQMLKEIQEEAARQDTELSREVWSLGSPLNKLKEAQVYIITTPFTA